MSNLRNKLATLNSKSAYEIADELNDLINDYIHNKLIVGTFNSSDFIEKTENQIEEIGVYDDVQRISNELGNILAKASEIAYTNYENY